MYMNILHIKRLLYYQRGLFTGLELYARYDWQVMRLHTHHHFFLIRHLCILAWITWKLQVVYGCPTCQITGVLSETFLFCLELHERSDWRAIPQTRNTVILSCNILSVQQTCICVIIDVHCYVVLVTTSLLYFHRSIANSFWKRFGHVGLHQFWWRPICYRLF